MAITLEIDTTLDTVLEKIARAGVRHPTALTRELLAYPVLITFSMGDDDETPTATLSAAGTHDWPFADETTRVFDDRGLA